MKFLVAFLCLAAAVAAEPEADASVLYGAGYGYPALGYGYGAYGYGYPAYAYRYPTGASYQQINTPFSVSAVSQIHKREAEADASVLAYAPYTAAYAYAPYAYAYPTASSYQQINTPYSVSAVSQIHKREAEADASVLAYSPYTAAYAYAPYAYAYPTAASYQQISTPFSISATSQIHKREAEPQAPAVHPGLATSSTFRSVQGAAGLSLYPQAYSYYPYAYGYAY